MLLNEKYQSIQDQGIPTIKSYVGEYVNEFLEDKKKDSVNTYEAYLSNIKNFFLDVFNKDIQHVTKEHLELVDYGLLKKYRDNLYEQKRDNGKRKNSNNTINRKIAAIRSLMKEMKARKVVSHDISGIDEVKKLPKDGKAIEHISVENSFKIADWVLEHSKHKKKEKNLFILLAIESGIRVSEVLSIKWSDFSEFDGKIILKGIGKGGKEFIDEIDKYLYEDLLSLKREDDDKVFTLKYFNVNDMMKQATAALKIDDKKYSCHSFKKTSVTFVYRKTGSIQAAKQKGRHASYDTTAGYIEEIDIGATGVISMTRNVKDTLYKEVDPQILISAIEKLGGDIRMLINIGIKEIEDKMNIND